MYKQDFIQLLRKYDREECTEDEIRKLNAFFEFYQENADWPEELHSMDQLKDEILNNINDNIFKHELESKRKLTLPIYSFLKVAALVIFVVLVGWAGWHTYNPTNIYPQALIEKSTKKGQKSTLILSDGSHVRLNSNSKISFPKQFTSSAREVWLEGEAFFEVVPNKHSPFIIKTRDLTTTVLGTTFNIKAFPKENIEVTVATGKVQVFNTASDGAEENTQNVILRPNEQASFNSALGIINTKKVQAEQYLAWKEGTILFEDVTLQEAAIILERWYGVSIIFKNENLKHCRISSGKYKDENLFNILKSFQYFLDLQFTAEEQNTIILDGGKCEKTADNQTILPMKKT